MRTKIWTGLGVCAAIALVHCGGEDEPTPGDGTSSSSGDAPNTSSSSSGNATSSSSSSSSGSGTSTSSSSSSSGQLPTDGGNPTDFAGAGPAEVTRTTASATTPNGCDLAYVRYVPDGTVRGRVVLTHGFQRSVDDMEGVAARFASWGFEVVSAPLCEQSISGADHEKNGEALVELATSLGLADPIYSGFSAGGLAAYLAADATGADFLGLDPVDNDLAVDAAPLAGASRVVFTEPGSCNKNNDFVPILADDPNARAVRAVGAGHFNVEAAACSGLDFGCSFCTAGDADTHEVILRFATAGLAELAGDAQAAGFFDPSGAAYQAAVADGTIEAP